MNAKTSRTTFFYQVKSQALSDTLRIFNPKVAPVLDERYAVTTEEGEPAIDWAFLLEQDVRQLDRILAQALAADHSRGEALELRVEAVETRTIHDSVLRGVLLGIQDKARRLHGRPSGRRLGFSGPLPRRATDLVNFAREVKKRLGDSLLSLPSPRRGLSPLKRLEAAIELDEAIQVAEEAVNQHGEVAAQAHAALETKHEEQEKLRRAYVHILRRMESTYRLAGFDNLADRLRASVRNTPFPRPGGGDVPDAGDPAGTGEPVDTGEPADAGESA